MAGSFSPRPPYRKMSWPDAAHLGVSRSAAFAKMRAVLAVHWADESELEPRPRQLLDRLGASIAVGVRAACSREVAAAWTARVLAAKDSWTHDFSGEQFSLGRAFYTHLETGKTRAYFDGARASDDLVERALPGMQASALGLLSRGVGGEVRRRRGFCGPGVHVFPAGGNVAENGGVVHFDLEGLTEHQLRARAHAVTLVWMLCPAEHGGGLRLFDALYDGRPDGEVRTSRLARRTVTSRPGDALFIDSYRLHQIRPFGGARDRISITVHAVEIDANVWDAWF